MKSLLISILLLVPFLLTAQQPVPCDSLLERLAEPVLTGDVYEIPMVTGESQYFSDEWLKGSVTLSNGLTLNDQHFKYNGYIDQLLWINKNYLQIKLDKKPILSFTLRDKDHPDKYYYFEKLLLPGNSGTDSAACYAQILYDDKFSLLVRRKVIRNGTEQWKAGRVILDNFEKKNIYYFREGNRISKGTDKIRKKYILDILQGFLPETTPELWTDKRFRIKTEEELTALTEWLNRTQNW